MGRAAPMAFALRHPLLAYCAVVFAVSWGGILLLVGPGGVPLDVEHLALLIGVGYVAILAGPSLAAILLTGLLGGRPGLRDLGSRLVRWRVGARWYAAALLVAPLSILVVLLALSVVSPVFVPRLAVEDDRLALLQYSVVSALLVGVFEEIGWTGFAVPLLRRRHGVLATGLIVGLLYVAWKLLIVYLVEAVVRTPGALPMVVFLPATLLTWQVAYRVVLVWVYDRTGGLPVAMVMATSLTASWTSLNPLTQTRETLVVFYVILAAVWWALMAAVGVASTAASRKLHGGGLLRATM
jgi:hypothetical protein